VEGPSKKRPRLDSVHRRHTDRTGVRGLYLQAKKAALGQILAKSPTALAIGYSLSNWRALTRFLEDRRIEADNNIAVGALRGVAIGRKNYLHFGSDGPGHTAAVIHMLIGTAKLCSINPQAYLRYVLERIADRPINRIDELLPWAVSKRLGRGVAQPAPLPLAA
jgi:hypothetical protein